MFHTDHAIPVEPLFVGPILGATDTRSIRVFGRADFRPRPQYSPEDTSFPTPMLPRLFAAARIWREGTTPEPWATVAKMTPNFDFTAVIVLNDLEPDTVYHYQMGWFRGAGEPKHYEKVAFRWSAVETTTVRTAAPQETTPRNFVFGSCRYLLRLFPKLWLFDDRGDKVFRTIYQQMESEQPLHAFLMIGDQIYADDLDDLRSDDSLHQFNRRYTQALSREHLRRLMARVPTYMTLDDHEIEDAWPARASHQDWLRKYPSAIHSYLTYQASHSPLFEVDATHPHRITGVPDHLWYTFQDGCCDFFVTDGRTERYLSNHPEERAIVSEEQLEALLAWIADGSPRVKMLVSAVPFFPDNRELLHDSESTRDKWSGFPRQRQRVLDALLEHRPRRLVLLSGDSHLSMAATLRHADHPDFRIHSVISSPFFWPYPHPRRDKFQEPGPLVGHPGFEVSANHYQHVTDNYTRVGATPDRLVLAPFTRKGKALGGAELEL